MIAGHGPNIGHGYVKYVVIDARGRELPPIIFPAQIAPAGQLVSGSLGMPPSGVSVDQSMWWVGEDALLAPAPITILTQDRLSDPVFIPALVRGALDQFGPVHDSGVCVTGLPASWSDNRDLATQLGSRLREASPIYQRIRVIAEPLGLMYSMLLNNEGEIVGDSSLRDGRVGVVDLGHHSVDIAVLRRAQPEPSSLDTWLLGSARPLTQIRAHVSARYERELSLYETDMTVRAGCVVVGGTAKALPAKWDDPLLDNSHVIVSRLRERWGSGSALDTILIGGGGAELTQQTEAIIAAFPHAQVVDQPQTAIARGYARLARRTGRHES